MFEKIMLFWNAIIILALIVILIYYYCTRNFNHWKNKNVPYKKPMFFFGNIIHLIRECSTPEKSMAKFYSTFDGPYYGFFAFNDPQLVLKDPQLIRDVLIKDFQVFQNRSIYSNERIDPIASNSLSIIRQPQWRLLRTKLTPAFTSEKMKMMFRLMNDCGKNLENYVGTIVGKDDVEVKDLTAKYTTDIIATCAFGIGANSFVNENSEFQEAGRRIFARSFFHNLLALCYFFAPTIVKIFRFPFIDQQAANFLRGVFNETIRQRQRLKYKRNDLIDILLDLKSEEKKADALKLYGDRLVSQAVVFFAAGHETISSTIAFTMHELGLNENIQTRLRREVLNVIKRYGDLTYEAVQDMKYLDMVVSETLRKYPLTPLLQRQCETNYTFSGTGLKLKKGTTVLISQHGLHWDPKYYPNPETFDPERFSNENKHEIPSYVYLPFGDGPRNCIGEKFGLLSSKLGIIHIIRKFRVERNYLTKEPVECDRSPLLRSKNGIYLTFQPLY